MRKEAPVYREDLTVYEVTIETMEPTIPIYYIYYIYLLLFFTIFFLIPSINTISYF